MASAVGSIDGSERPIVGIDLGGTNMQIGVVAPTGEVLSRAKRKTGAEEGQDAVFERMVSGVEEACTAAGITVGDVSCLGIGAPGPIDPQAGVVIEAPNMRWRDVRLRDILQDRFGCPVAVDNDVNVAVWGEYRFGAGRGANHLLGAWVGTGVGGAIVLSGRLHYGHFLTAGEIGHMLVEPTHPPGLQKLEHIVSRTAIVNRIRHMLEASAESQLVEMSSGKLSKIKSRMLGDAYREGDELVREVIDDAADRLGAVLGGLATAMSLERVVLGGGLTEAVGEPFVARVRASLHGAAFPAALRAIIVVASELEDNAGVVGAAMLAKERCLDGVEVSAGAGS